MEREILKVDNDLCKLRACLDDTVPGVPIIHCEMKSWGKHESELFTFVWREFKSALKLMGFRGVCAVVPEDNTKLLKFTKLQGMDEVGRSNGYIIVGSEV